MNMFGAWGFAALGFPPGARAVSNNNEKAALLELYEVNRLSNDTQPGKPLRLIAQLQFPGPTSSG